MLVSQRFEEIRVYADVAERTGLLLERDDVRHSDRCCASIAQLIRKARASGDGTFYLKINVWPADTERIEVQKPWIVIANPFSGPDQQP